MKLLIAVFPLIIHPWSLICGGVCSVQSPKARTHERHYSVSSAVIRTPSPADIQIALKKREQIKEAVRNMGLTRIYSLYRSTSLDFSKFNLDGDDLVAFREEVRIMYEENKAAMSAIRDSSRETYKRSLIASRTKSQKKSRHIALHVDGGFQIDPIDPKEEKKSA